MRTVVPVVALASAFTAVSAAPTLLSNAIAAIVAPAYSGPAAPIASAIHNVVIGTVGTTLSAIDSMVGSYCDQNWKCNVTMSGKIEDLLSDGSSWTGRASVAAWCTQGTCYGAISLTGSAPAPAPLNITCDAVNDMCSGTAYVNIDQVFQNAQQIQLWGWATPSGKCTNGTCVGSINAVGDPAY